MTRVGIIGAGIGGLSAAIALRHAGGEVVVFEQAPEPRAVGAGLHLWSNALRALDEIGVADAVVPISVEVEREEVRRFDGRLLAEWPVADLSRSMGVPSITMTRPAFLGTLVDEAGAGTIRFGERFTGFSEDGSGVTLRFESGLTERCDLLVGADGLHSVVRDQLFGSGEPRYSGYTSWRTLVSREHDDVSRPFVRQYWGRGDRFVYFPAGPDHIYLVALANAARGERDEEGGAKHSLLARYRTYAEPVPRLIAASQDNGWVRTDIVDREPIDTWGKGRVTLLGDAAHPMTPNTSQGAGMAVEDAAVLARCIAKLGAGPDALDLYARQRHKRAGAQIKLARTAGNLGRYEHRAAVALRDQFIRLAFTSVVWRKLRRQTAAEF